ncbi:aspartate/glutamate racemase family protein [Desulfogranum mediterraneum]|uniref:aspartate/glutamate racemase family protein n=1 Tax=Desulfogranum mediterraneum TaxID=160661 RepID=UPI0004920E27|nr:aspartate/glutamate racemase family protein [Desulfogranum mediterraneum]
MQIGVIGGIGPAATDYYYRRLISEFARRKTALEMTIVHADPSTLLHNLERNDGGAQVEIYNRLTDRLASAGAKCVVVTSIAGHFCIDTFKENSPLQVIDILTEVNEAVKHRKLGRVGILGTRTVMETQFYSGISTAEVIPPIGRVLEDVHSAYVSMATAGYVTKPQRGVFDSACEWLIQEAEVDAIMLGGTDFALVYKESQSQFPIVDCAAIHVDAVVRHATI